jgi:hypothetical protein
VSCKAIKNLNITRRLGSCEEGSMGFEDVSPYIKFTRQEQGSMTVLGQLQEEMAVEEFCVGCS